MDLRLKTWLLWLLALLFVWFGVGGHFPFHEHSTHGDHLCPACAAILAAAVAVATLLMPALARLRDARPRLPERAPVAALRPRAAGPRAPPSM